MTNIFKKIAGRVRNQFRGTVHRGSAQWFAQADAAAERLGASGPNPRRVHPSQQNILEQIGAKHKPTKINHNYLEYYGRHFDPIRLEVKRFLEIGVQTPASLNMWEEYFPNADIIGLDIDPACRKYAGGRKRVFIGDQCDRNSLRKMIAEVGGGFDIIVDDGLHTEESILTSFVELFPAMSPNGIYVFEDLVDLPGVHNFSADLIHLINHFPKSHPTSEWRMLNTFGKNAQYLTRNVIGVAAYRYLTFIMKGANPEHNPYLLTPEEDAAETAELRARIRSAIDDLTAKGKPLYVPTISAMIGGGGHYSIRAVLKERGLKEALTD